MFDARLVSKEKDYLKQTSKPSYRSQKIFDNDLDTIRNSKVTFILNKPAHIGVCTLELSSITITLKINMVITKDYYSLALRGLCMNLKLKLVNNFAIIQCYI